MESQEYKTAFCRGNVIEIGEGQTFNFEEIFTNEFYRHSDELSHEYKLGSHFDNELYLYFTQTYLALERLLKSQNVNRVDVTQASQKLRFYMADLAGKNNLEISGQSSFGLLKVRAKAKAQLLATFAYLLWRMFATKRTPLEPLPDTFSIVRTSATRHRVLAMGIGFHFEDPFQKISVYSGFSFGQRVSWLCGALKKANQAYTYISQSMQKFSGKGAAADALSFYGKRLVHTYLYAAMAEHILQSKSSGTFYTGNNLDRFAIIEEELCKKFNLKLITLPHGLEYCFKLPHGFTGDVFYTTSALAARTLNHLYSETKYTFDQEKCDLFFKNDFQSSPEARPRVVFFTEPREAEVNVKILDQLLSLLRNEGIELFLKLHPKDSTSRYEHFDVKIMDDIKEALHHNICFARKSTALLEAVINGSQAAVILLNPKDDSIFRTFASLQIDEIEKCYDVQALFSWILKSIRETKEKV